MRYSRQSKFIGLKSQQKLKRSRVCIVGAGALGSHVADLLVRAGVSNIQIIDRDLVELTNLQRQAIYQEKDIGKPKSLVLKNEFGKINSEIKVEAKVLDLTASNIDQIKADLVIDCTDNLETRFLIDDYCAKNKITWIHSSAIGNIGNVYVITAKKTRLRAILKQTQGLDNCESVGVLGSIISVVSGMAFNEAIKVLTGSKEEKDWLRINLKNNTIDKIKISSKKVLDFDYLNGVKGSKNTKLCGKGVYQIKSEPIDLSKVKLQGKKFEGGIYSDKITVFSDGRVIVRAKNLEQAKKIRNRTISN